jgi:hypothetical protein
LSGRADANIDFAHLREFLKSLGFAEYVTGDHFKFSRPGVVEIINLQPVGKSAKVYQVRQVREILLRYGL